MRMFLAGLALCATLAGCSSSDTRNASDQANKVLQQVNKAAHSVATSEPVLATRDALLAIAVKARLAAADVDSTTSVSVGARDGVVTLDGSVRTAREAALLPQAARSVTGVKVVRTHLHIDAALPSAQDQARDLALAARVMATVAQKIGLGVLSVRATAKSGAVTLGGSVRNRADHQTTLSATRSTRGVRSVVDDLRIVP